MLSHTQLRDADLTGADLRDADLVEANLNNTGLEEAKLAEASLCSANLVGTRMRSAKGLDHERTKLDGATYHRLSTDWPNGFDPLLKGAKTLPRSDE